MDNKSGKVLILFNSIPYFLDFFNRNGVTGSWIFKEKISFSQKVLRKIFGLLKIAQAPWYENWKKELNSYETVIIFAPLKDNEVINFIKSKNKNIRIIYWYWNPVARVGYLEDKFHKHVELWSFDPRDCKKYGMNFNTTFYFKDIPLPENKIKYDTFFVGLDKGRSSFLKELQDKITVLGATTYFKIIPGIKEKISYHKYLEFVSKTKCIIDITPGGQSGLTVRPMESIFFRKKLITSEVSIAGQDFYHEQNIFILGKDNDSRLKEFIESPYIPLEDAIINEYDFDRWLKRFNY